GLDGDGQIGRLVLDDAVQARGVQYDVDALGRRAQVELGTTALGCHGLARFVRRVQGLRERIGRGRAHLGGDAQGHSQPAAPPRRANNSRQRPAVGKPLPGLHRPSGSTASLMRCIWAMSAWLKISGIRSFFSMPMPCSPLSEPPAAAHVRMISAPASITRSSAPGTSESHMISGCRLPSPAWNTLAIRKPDSLWTAWIRASAAGSFVRGTTPSTV